MDPSQARAIALQHLTTMSASDAPLALIDDAHVADVGWGLVYAWNTARWFETRDPADAAGPGAGPIVVIKATGEVFHLGSTPAIDEQLADYARRHGLASPPPLGW